MLSDGWAIDLRDAMVGRAPGACWRPAGTRYRAGLVVRVAIGRRGLRTMG